MKMAISVCLAGLVFLAGCSELHQTGSQFTATGTSANILFFQIPRDPMVSAQQQIPSGAMVTNTNNSPNDWHTVVGFLNRLLGVGWSQIGGKTQ